MRHTNILRWSPRVELNSNHKKLYLQINVTEPLQGLFRNLGIHDDYRAPYVSSGSPPISHSPRPT